MQRLTISDVLERLAAIGETRGFNMKSGIKLASAVSPVHAAAPPPRPPAPHPSPQAPRRPPPPQTSSSPSPARVVPVQAATMRMNPMQIPSAPLASSSSPNSGLFSSLKGGAGNLLKNLKVLKCLVCTTCYV